MYSLKGKACFKHVYRKGQKIRQKNCTFFVVAQCALKESDYCKKNDNTIKIGIVVPRYFGKAFLRNRAKRKFKEAFRDYCLTEHKDYCMIVRLYTGFIDMTQDEIKKEIRDCFYKIKSMRPSRG
ncbi:MAG: ribonuclease P protein component [Spirochaetota bacterium]